MILDTTSKVLEIILGGAKTTNDCEFTADYVDTQSGTTFAPAGTIGLSNGATLVTAVAAPAASTQRAVRAFTFYNADTVNTAVTVRIFDGTNRRRIIVMTLTPGQSLVFTPEAGWAVLPSTNGQIPGTVTNDSATAGNVGEFVTATVALGVPVGLTSSVEANITSISLSPGDWDLNGVGWFTGPSSTVVQELICAINTISATQPTRGLTNLNRFVYGATGFAIFAQDDTSVDVGVTRLSLAAQTTVYIIAKAYFTVNTCSAYGQISARRAR